MDQLLDLQHLVHDLLQAKPAKKYSFSGSQTGKPEAVSALMAHFSVKSIIDGEPPARWPRALQSKQYTAHLWRTNPLDEDVESPDLLKHFRDQLQHFGVSMETRGGFDLKDVRQQHKLTFFADLPSIGQVTFAGGTDAVVVPHHVASWQMQTRVIIDWKTPISLSKPDSCESQALLELIGSLHASQFPPLVVLTDCVNFVIYKPYQKTIQRWHTFAHQTAGCISGDDSMRLITQFLLDTPTDNAFDYTSVPNVRARAEQFELLRMVKQKLDDGEGLVAQLGVVSELPEDERFTTAQQLTYSWARAQAHFPFYIT